MPDIYNAKKESVTSEHNKNVNSEKIVTNDSKKLEKEQVKHSKSKHQTQSNTYLGVNNTSKGSVFSSYCFFPKNVNFYHKDSHEKIVLLLRRHPITNIPWNITAFFMLIAPAFFSVLAFTEMIPWEYKLVFGIVWYMVTIAFIMEEFLSWFYHVNIVTDERILEVDFVNLLYREITDANIDQIQDVTVEMGGIWRTFFKFGDVVIQTAGEVPRIRFEGVPDPDNVAKILRELRVEEEQEKLEGRVR